MAVSRTEPQHGPPLRGLLVTGTDTGVGKTVVTAAVVRLLRGQGRDCRVCKPVATGATAVAGRLVSDDTLKLAEAVGRAQDWHQITPWTFSQPVAPPVAARLSGIALTVESVAEAVCQQHQPGSALVVEGVGGLLCPLTERETVADLALMLGLPLVVVARRSLGTLNHTLLTLETARRRGLVVVGVVMSETSPPVSLAEQTNVEELRKRITVPLLGVVPYQSGPQVDAGPALAGIDWWQLCHAETPRSRDA